ncbi:hypothetical protein [Coraliomargarita akajimensis]|uniref:Uncharacterized protein n=1 Tax=Coraliomargarita akajimensis (strain DSM 45221 / IAM 15411 / JCM 23193 / KCTC 12865 / 04OKA010-24) TaxID=583355 RepID=D5EKQ3_CORAD|nr:hypothetical protein [Coraliomargarita akajimensis]ADE54960.1 hypothetical protein Caka_1942 [Coraliomargarita akajimensis DSM 45221]
MLRKLAVLLALFFAASAVATAQDVVVDKVDFKSLRDSWVQVEIQLSCVGNSAADARDPKYLENIKVKPYLAYPKGESTSDFVYFTSEVEIMIMEARDKNRVYFYIPGLIIDRDRLKFPKYYYVELEVNGQPVEPSKKSFYGVADSSLPNLKSSAESGAAVNSGALIPYYHAPSEVLGGVRDLPIVVRRDGKE